MNELKGERIISLDIIRGFAILGIFIVNMLSFHSPIMYMDPLTWWDSPLDHGTYKVINVLAEGSFYPLFAMLFGYGLVILRERTLARGENFRAVAIRRLTFLLLFGVIHAFLIWHGDILITYAMVGFLFLLLLRASSKVMLITGALLAIIPNLFFSLLMTVVVLIVPEEELVVHSIMDAEQVALVYQEGSYTEITAQRVKDWFAVNNPLNSIILVLMILPPFLIGGGAAKLKLMERVKQLKKPLAISFSIFLVFGLFLKLLPYTFNYNLAFQYIAYSFGGPLLALAYALGIALLLESRWRKPLALIAPVGKMSLSNYLFQSILATLIFYSYGLGLFSEVSVLWGTALVFLIYGLQVIFSRLWMKNHLYGPAEWVWRTATYWKKQPWKIEAVK